MDRRSVLKLLGALPFVPWSPVPESVKTNPFEDKILRGLKYARYTDDQFKQCRVIVFDEKGGKFYAPRINRVERESEKILLHCENIPITFTAVLTHVMLRDLDGDSPGRCPFYANVNVTPGDNLTICYTLEF